MAHEVFEDEVVAAEAWIGAPCPAPLKALWAHRGYGVVNGSQDVILSPLDVADAMVPTTKGLPFMRAPDGSLYRIDAEGHVLDRSGSTLANDPDQFVESRLVRAEVGETGAIRRALRTLAGVVGSRDGRVSAGA